MSRGKFDHSRAPLLDAIADYHRQDRYGFTPPGHRQGRGADPRARDILGEQTYRSDMLASGGLDDRSSSHGYLRGAEELMADAVGSDQAFFSTAGSSLSVKAAAWDRHPTAAGALIVSPTPYGTCADIAALADICHRRRKPLIVDEAWGAHLPFHEDLPTWAMDAARRSAWSASTRWAPGSSRAPCCTRKATWSTRCTWRRAPTC